MIPYIFLVLFVFLVEGFIGQRRIKNSDSKKKQFLFFSLLPFFILLAFRGESVGSDTYNYMRSFREVYYDERLEIGYLYLVYFIKIFFSNPRFLLIITAFFTTISIGRFIYKAAKDPALALLFFITLGLFQFSLSGIRQTIAISITLWLFPLIRQRKFIKFILGVYLASLFHKSAYFFIPAYFIAGQELNKKKLILETIVFMSIFLIADKILLSLADFMDYNYGIEETDNGFFFFFVVLVITIASLINIDKILGLNLNNKYMININLISLMIWTIRLISRTAERASFYFMPYTYVTLEEYVTSKNNKLIYWFVVLFSVALFLFRVLNNSSIYPFIFSF